MKKAALAILTFLLAFYNANSQGEKMENQNEHQFDFWIGEWNVYKFGTDTIVGISYIKPILDHKTIEENYQSLKYKYKGKSFNIYNPKEKQWEQFWVDNSGLRLFMTGGIKDSKMILSDCKDNEDVCNRITWTDLKDRTVRQEWEQSKDNGKTWSTVFDGHYKKRE